MASYTSIRRAYRTGDEADLEELDIEELVHHIEIDDEISTDASYTSSQLVSCVEEVLTDKCFLGYTSSLLKLIRSPPPSKCSTCDEATTVSESLTGTAINLTWVWSFFLLFSILLIFYFSYLLLRACLAEVPKFPFVHPKMPTNCYHKRTIRTPWVSKFERNIEIN